MKGWFREIQRSEAYYYISPGRNSGKPSFKKKSWWMFGNEYHFFEFTSKRDPYMGHLPVSTINNKKTTKKTSIKFRYLIGAPWLSRFLERL